MQIASYLCKTLTSLNRIMQMLQKRKQLRINDGKYFRLLNNKILRINLSFEQQLAHLRGMNKH